MYSENNPQIRDFNHGFLGTLDPLERNKWVKENQIDTKVYLSDFPEAEVRFVSVCGVFLDLKAEDVVKMSSGDWLTIEEVYNMFPRKPGSKAKKHTLIFRPNIWSIIDSPENDDILDPDIYFDLIDCTYSEEKTRSRVKIITLENNLTIGICDEKQTNGYLTISDEVEKHLDWFTPGILKSLIQKCIRMNAVNVAIGDEEYSNQEVLLSSFLLLLKHPGTFVPDLKSFVKGSESAMKRLAVSIVEDSYMSSEIITSLLFSALAARDGWVFSDDYIEKCCEWALKSLDSKYLTYDCNKISNAELDQEYEVMCLTIETLKSFQTDINMFRTACESNWEYNECDYEQPEVMRVEHCFDQHCVPDVVYLINIKEISPEEGVSLMWNKASKFNSRKHNFEIDEEIELAQLRYWVLKTSIPDEEEIEDFEVLTYSRMIDESWISGMVGPIKNTHNKINKLSFFHPENISSIVTMRDTSRAKDQEELSLKDKLLSEENVLSIDSFKLKETSIEVDHTFIFKNDVFYMTDNCSCKNSCKCEKKEILWTDYCNGEIQVCGIGNCEELSGISFDDQIEFISSVRVNGIFSNWKEIIQEYITSEKIEVILRISMYIRSISDIIQVHQLSRDGKGTYLSVNWTDLHVFRFFCLCCYLIPGAIKIKKDKSLRVSFEITNMFVWNNLRAIIFDFIGKSELFDWHTEIKNTFKNLNLEYKDDWTLSDFDSRVMKPHQEEAVDQIINRVKFGKRGNIIFISVGGGKTFIVINTLFQLLQRKALPKYVLFALPATAYLSVSDDFKKTSNGSYILPIHLLTTKKIKGDPDANILKPFHINFISHDHLRHESIKSQLVENSSELFIIFDEFHKMMATNTQRTSVSLELSNICQNFIAMTGTLMINKDPAGILNWTKQIVDFKLEEKNYMVGIASLISSKIKYGIEERRHYIEAEIEEGNDYFKYVPSTFGGSARVTDFRKAIIECYKITQETIFDVGMNILDGDDEEEPEDNIFVVALNAKMQSWLSDKFTEAGKKTFCIGKGNGINMTPGTHTDIKVVITTNSHNSGYNLTSCRVMISGIYFSNAATRTQLEGRICRTGQPSSFVDYIFIHCGLLSYTLKHYEETRSLEKALGDLSKEIEM